MSKEMIQKLIFAGWLFLVSIIVLLLVTAPGAFFGLVEVDPNKSLLGLDSQLHVDLILILSVVLIPMAVIIVTLWEICFKPAGNES